MPVLTRQPIQAERLIAQASAADRGGIATFLGLVRNHHGGRAVVGIEYSAYEPMAERVCGDIVGEAEARWPVRVLVEHRLGALMIGDVAVLVVAAGSHRDEAFTACRYVIEELKTRVPIWKRETYADGTESWVDPTAAGGSRPAETGRSR